MAAPLINQTQQVYIRQHWADEWELQTGLYCDSFTEVAGPDVCEATLRRSYGKVQDPNSVSFVDRAPLDIAGWYVKVVVTQYTADDPDTVRTWRGVVVEIPVDRRGRLSATSGNLETGEQIFLCRGLEFLLQRTILDSSFVLDANGEEIEIGRAIGFNLGPGRSTDHDRHGNKSGTIGERDAYIFAYDIGVGGVKTETVSTMWSVQDIIVYLLHYHHPRDVDGADKLNWKSPDGGDAEILSKIFPTIHVHGKTLFQILNELIDRRRLVGWNIIFEGASEQPKINVFTFNETAINLPGGATIPPNGSLQTWHFDEDPLVGSAAVAVDDATRFDVVIVRGAPLGACFTIAATAGTTPYTDLIADWATTLQTSYNTGASTSGAYGALHAYDKQVANQAFRADEQFAKVFRAFLLNPAWDGIAPGFPTCPDPTLEAPDGSPSETSTKFWYPGLRFLDYLPLRTDYDYSTVEDFETGHTTRDNSQPNYLRPFAVTKIGSLYYRLDRPGHTKLVAETLKSAGIEWAASLRMQDNCPGLIIDVQGAAQHVIAEAEFTPADPDDAADEESNIDWKDIAVTVFCEFDQHVEARYPEGVLSVDSDTVRELIIDLPHYRLDYLAPTTIIGIDDDGALVTSTGGYVHDDRAIMQDIARCAYAWYGRARKALTVVKRDLVADFQVGDLITTIGTTPHTTTINSVVTKQIFDLRARSVTAFTQYAQLDPLVALG